MTLRPRGAATNGATAVRVVVAARARVLGRRRDGANVVVDDVGAVLGSCASGEALDLLREDVGLVDCS